MIKKILLLLMFLPVYLLAWKMESGTVTLPETTVGSSIWQTVTLQQSYDTTPLIFAMPDEGIGHPTDSPAALRVRNVGLNSFEIVQVEPQPDDGAHAGMTIHYIAIEPGDHTLPDGTRFSAATHMTTSSAGKNNGLTDVWDPVSITPAFGSTPPIVLGMIQSVSNENNILPGTSSSPWMTVGIDNVTTAGFDTTLERAETSSNSNIVNDETIGYLAIDSGVSGSIYIDNGSCQKIDYQTINTGNNVSGWINGCYVESFGTTYPNAPLITGSMQSRNGGDGGWLRRCSLSTSSVGLTIDEDNIDGERGHTTEIVGLALFSQTFMYDSTTTNTACNPMVNFQMDECYWLGGANGVLDDVKDSSGNDLHAQSRNRADNIASSFKICRAGDFVNTYPNQSESDAIFYPNETAAELAVGENQPFTVSAWVYRHNDNKWMAAVIKVSDDAWNDGWGLEHRLNSGANIDFFVGDYNTYARAALATDTWTHVVGTYDGTNIRIYTNGVLRDTTAQNTYTPGALAAAIGDDLSGSATDDRWQGNIDEVKIWDRALTQTEITDMYDNENAGLNYDGTSRECKSCNGSSIIAGTWDLIGVPADSRTTPLTVNDVFGDDMNGTHGQDWRIYKRTYSSVDNSSDYLELALTDTLEFGQGYWLGSSLNSEWYVDGTPTVDYNVTNPACQAATCVEIPLTAATKDFDVDANDGSGNYRNNMTGFIGIDKPVEWADCRLIIDGTAYTPSDANTTGLANKQIWLYDPDNSGANSNGYTTCDDVTPGGCKLVPFKGFWIQLTGKTKGSSVKLLVPEE